MNQFNQMRLQPEPPLPGHRLEILHEEQDIRQRIAELSKEIREQLGDKDPIVVCVLKGAFVFVADLVRQLDFPFTVDFLRASSYGD